MPSRFTSRKFITSLLAQVTSMVVLIFPAQADPVHQWSTSLTALVLLGLSTLGYLHTEGKVDAEREKTKQAESGGVVGGASLDFSEAEARG